MLSIRWSHVLGFFVASVCGMGCAFGDDSNECVLAADPVAAFVRNASFGIHVSGAPGSNEELLGLLTGLASRGFRVQYSSQRQDMSHIDFEPKVDTTVTNVLIIPKDLESSLDEVLCIAKRVQGFEDILVHKATGTFTFMTGISFTLGSAGVQTSTQEIHSAILLLGK